MKRGLAVAAVALGLAASVTAHLGAFQRDQGIARDEVVYMHAGADYASWWMDALRGEPEAQSAKAITSHFGGEAPTANNREHPPLMKTLFGLSEALFHDSLGWTSRVTANRLPTAMMSGILAALVFLFTRRLWGDAAGVGAALLAVLMPRTCFHGQLAAFDVPIATLWFATVVAYYRALDSRRWCVVLGLVFGLALATKHNALMIPGALGLHYLYIALRARWPAIARARGGARWKEIGKGLLGPRPLAIASMAILGPLVLVALWPWLWFDTLEHVAEWLRFHLDHVHYNFEYLGENWNAPPFPFHVPIVTTLLVVPAVTLVTAAIGVLSLARDAHRKVAVDRRRAPALLLSLSALVAIAPFLLGQAPIFGAAKHWLVATVSLAIAAGVGIVRAARWAGDALAGAEMLSDNAARQLRAGLVFALLASAAGAAAIETQRAQPYALTHYSDALGGAPAGADLGMNRQYWGYAVRGVLPVLREHAPDSDQGARPVYTHDASPAWPIYRREGDLPEGLRDAGHERAGVRRSELAIVVHELHFNRHDYMIWDEYGTLQPIFVLRAEGVPIVSVYRRPESEP